MFKVQDKLILAIDTPNVDNAYLYAKKFKNHVAAIKLGLEFFMSQGPVGIKKILDLDIPLFLDMKLHDIPNTVASAVREAVKLDIFMLTIHCSGGKEMLRRAVDIAKETADKYNVRKTNLLGVTVLTALDNSDLGEIGYIDDVEKNVLNFASIAKDSGLDGVICSAHEVSILRKKFGDDFKLVVPGIRFEKDMADDQKRVMSPRKALELGADYLVMGRSILKYDGSVEDMSKEFQYGCLS